MKLAKKRTLTCGVMFGLTMIATGCMTSPYQDQHIGHSDEDVRFDGFLLEANEPVAIQAFDGRSWQTIGWSRSAGKPYVWNGMEFYPWHATIEVPPQFWTKEYQNISASNDLVDLVGTATVRACSDAGTLLTITDDFMDWFEPEHESPIEMLADHHHGTTATIFARHR